MAEKKKVCGFLSTSGQAKGWKNIPEGGLITEAGNSEEYYTGSWRTFRPLVDKNKCTNCMICWIMCPDSSILVEGEKMEGFDYDHCKGCGICAEVCPFKCIIRVREDDFENFNKDNDFDEQGRTTTKDLTYEKK